MSDFENTIDDLNLKDNAVIASIIDRTITEFKDNKIKKLGKYAFRYCQELTTVELPICTNLGGNYFDRSYTFADCYNLRYISLPEVKEIPADCFFQAGASSDYKLELYLPKANTFGQRSFSIAKAKLIDTSNLSDIRSACFSGAEIRHLVLRINGICALNADSGLRKDTHIYVRRTLLNGYKAAANWSEYQNNFRALEDYTVNESTTGELDWDKVNENA